ncbi:family 2 glycosyl transferase [Candidatus Magnetoovum chiemensis]|nr:family 2 glycosyl transferase [Candidatus Magnetoovum chiemensis]
MKSEVLALKQLGIIIPVYNEKDNIGITLESINNKVKTPHKIYIVYDFDEDNTVPVVRQYQDRGSFDVKLVKNPDRGVLNAIKCGFSEAKEKLVLVTMADLSDDYNVVDEMCALADIGYDIVCGSRYMKGGRQVGGPLLKKLMSYTACITLKYLAGIPTHDATNSFKLYKKALLDDINIESEGGFELGLEIVVKAHLKGCRITEVPCYWFDRQHGQSRFKLVRWTPKYLKWYILAFRGA